MACMCGDTHCPSCGPAQGNTRCVICRAWHDDGCEHVDEDSGLLKREFEQVAKDITDVERLGDMIDEDLRMLEDLHDQRVNLTNAERRELELAVEIKNFQHELLKRGVKFP